MRHDFPPLTIRFRGVLLFGTLVAAACSATSSVSPPANAQVGTQPANVRRSLLLSEGFGTVPTTPTRAKSWIAPDVKGEGLNIYWGDYYNNTIAIYPRSGTNPPEKGLITKGVSGPERLFVDSALTVYATNIGNNTITAYKRHRTRPSLRISSGVADPTGITVDAAGTIYCANTGTKTITVYPKGQTTPSLTIPIPGTPEYLAIDSSDNLYVSYFGGPTGTAVMEFAPGSTTGKDLGLDMGGGGALEVDRSGNIIIADNYGSTLDFFPAGQTELKKRIGMPGGGEIFGLSLSETEHKLFLSVWTNGTFSIQQINYPNLTSLTTKLSTYAGNWPIAVGRDAVL